MSERQSKYRARGAIVPMAGIAVRSLALGADVPVNAPLKGAKLRNSVVAPFTANGEPG